MHRRTNTHRSAAQRISPASFAKTSTHFLTFKNKSRAAEQQSFVEFQAERTAQHTAYGLGNSAASSAAAASCAHRIRAPARLVKRVNQQQCTHSIRALPRHLRSDALSSSLGNETERSLLGALAYSLSLSLLRATLSLLAAYTKICSEQFSLKSSLAEFTSSLSRPARHAAVAQTNNILDRRRS